jgi:5-hydroxyisourate hydrolase
MSPITTHVLDTTRGRPAAGVRVVLEHHTFGTEWKTIGRGETNADGRLRTLMREDATIEPGMYRLVFDTRSYFGDLGVHAFYPEVVIIFETVQGESHYHVPLLVSPFGYTTYRGS